MKPARILPPSGAPLYIKDLFRGVLGIIKPVDTLERFEAELKSYFGVRHVFPVSSGKAALTLILQSLAEITGKREVVLPSYTCFSVPSSVVKAGLRPVICDISENDINYDPDRLREVVGKQTLCIIATHMFGIPCDMTPILSAARSEGCYVVEDSAQAMGAELNGNKTGTLGDVGFFSLGRGKSLSAVCGGIIITNDDTLAETLGKRYSALKAPTLVAQLISLCVAIFLYIFSRPSLYWLPAGLPFLKIGQTIYNTEFSVEKLAGFNAGLVANWKRKLESFNAARRKTARIYQAMLNGSSFVSFEEPGDSLPIYLRFPLLADSPAKREAVLARLSAAGLGGSANYPTGIVEIPELEIPDGQKSRCKEGDNLAKRILTLPTHPAVSDRDRENIAAMLYEEMAHPVSGLTYKGSAAQESTS